MKKILITGDKGLVGRHLSPILRDLGYEIHPFDIKDDSGDILNKEAVMKAVQSCDGIIHLAAVSRVVWAEKNPDLCWETNVLSSKWLIQAAMSCEKRPWIIAASSREVYGQAKKLPVSEDTPLEPLNIYGKSKVEMEKAIVEAQKLGLKAAIIRLSNVYGCHFDHNDRVIPAFCRAAVSGTSLRVDGENTLFDFTHISDVAAGIVKLVQRLEISEESLPPIHFVSGQGTSLHKAAQIVVNAANSTAEITFSSPRSYDVSKFCGNPLRAKELLGWEPNISLFDGVSDLVNKIKNI